MSDSQQQAEAATAQVSSHAPGLVAHSAGEGVAFRAATFTEFVAAHVAQLPQDERGPALAWLTGLSGLFAPPTAPRV